MCGRAKLPDDVSEIKLDLKIDWDEIGTITGRAGTRRRPRNFRSSSRNNGERTLTLMRWGLVPSGPRTVKIGYSTFNARAEGIDTPAGLPRRLEGRPPLPRDRRRYYEWRAADKQPFAVALGNRGPMTFAGLWDLWRAPDGNALKSFAIITTARQRPARALARSHAGPARAGPLGPAGSARTAATDAELKAMLKPYPGAAMAFWPVDRRVGNVRNDSPDLFAPLAQAGSEPPPARIECGQRLLPSCRRLMHHRGHTEELHPRALPYIV